MTLPRLNLSIKLPMLIGVLCISLAISIGAASQWLYRAVMLNAAHTRLETAAQAQSEAVASWFDAIENDLVITATNPTTRTAITWFGNAFRDMGEINASMAELGRVTQENASMVSDVSDTGRALHQDTQDLVGLVAYFQVKNPGDGQRPNPPVEFRSRMSSAPPVPMSVPAHATARAILPSLYSEFEGQWQDS